MGSEAAGAQLGIDPRTIVKWMAKAGDRPELDGEAGQWSSLLDLAHARTQAALASGKLTAVQVATIAGIAQRNLDRVRDKATAPESAVAVREAFEEWLTDAAAEAMSSLTEADYQATMEGVKAVLPGLIRRANAEPGQPHREAVLAWFSGRTEFAAGDVLQWAQELVRAMLLEHKTLAAWHAVYLLEKGRLDT